MRRLEGSLKKDENKNTTSNLIGSSVVELSLCEIQNVSGGVLDMLMGGEPKDKLVRQCLLMSVSGAILGGIAPFPWIPMGVLILSVSVPVFTSTLAGMATAVVVTEKLNGAIVAAIGYAVYNKYLKPDDNN